MTWANGGCVNAWMDMTPRPPLDDVNAPCFITTCRGIGGRTRKRRSRSYDRRRSFDAEQQVYPSECGPAEQKPGHSSGSNDGAPPASFREGFPTSFPGGSSIYDAKLIAVRATRILQGGPTFGTPLIPRVSFDWSSAKQKGNAAPFAPFRRIEQGLRNIRTLVFRLKAAFRFLRYRDTLCAIGCRAQHRVPPFCIFDDVLRR